MSGGVEVLLAFVVLLTVGLPMLAVTLPLAILWQTLLQRWQGTYQWPRVTITTERAPWI